MSINNNVSNHCIGVDPCSDHEPASLCFFSIHINDDVGFISKTLEQEAERNLVEALVDQSRNIWKWIKARRI